MRNRNLKSTAFKTRDAHASAVSPCIFYKLHEGSGTAFVDALGNGPDFTLTGTGTPLTNAGWVTPNGTDDMLAVAAANMGILTDIFRMDDAYGQLIIGFDLWTDGSSTGYETIFQAGVATTTVGHIGVGLSSAGSALAISTRGVGASTNSDDAFAFTFGGLGVTDKRMQCVVEIVRATANTIDANCYINGAIVGSKTGISWLDNSGTGPYAGPRGTPLFGATMMGLQGFSSVARRLNSLGSNSRISRFLAHKSTTRDATLALTVAQQMYFEPGDFPRALRVV